MDRENARTIIHIGLHKTASTYLQKEIFRGDAEGSDDQTFVYNPREILDAVIPIFEFRMVQPQWRKNAVEVVDSWRSRNPRCTLLLSAESFSQVLYLNNFEEQLDLLKSVFVTFDLLVVLRNQADWVASVYKETLKSGDYQFLDSFLNYNSGTNVFTPVQDRFNSNQFVIMDPRKANWLNLVQCSNEVANSVFVMCFEDLGADRAGSLSELYRWMKFSFSTPVESRIRNRGVSTAGVQLLLYWGKIVRVLGVSTGYKVTYDRARSTYFADIRAYKQSRREHLTGIPLLKREVLRVFRKCSLYKTIAGMTGLSKMTFLAKTARSMEAKCKRQVRAMHSESNRQLFQMLNREAPRGYICNEKRPKL